MVTVARLLGYRWWALRPGRSRSGARSHMHDVAAALGWPQCIHSWGGCSRMGEAAAASGVAYMDEMAAAHGEAADSLHIPGWALFCRACPAMLVRLSLASLVRDRAVKAPVSDSHRGAHRVGPASRRCGQELLVAARPRECLGTKTWTELLGSQDPELDESLLGIFHLPCGSHPLRFGAGGCSCRGGCRGVTHPGGGSQHRRIVVGVRGRGFAGRRSSSMDIVPDRRV